MAKKAISYIFYLHWIMHHYMILWRILYFTFLTVCYIYYAGFSRNFTKKLLLFRVFLFSLRVRCVYTFLFYDFLDELRTLRRCCPYNIRCVYTRIELWTIVVKVCFNGCVVKKKKKTKIGSKYSILN